MEYSGLQQRLDIYEELPKAIPSLYEFPKDEDGTRSLKRVYKMAGRRYEEESGLYPVLSWPTDKVLAYYSASESSTDID